MAERNYVDLDTMKLILGNTADVTLDERYDPLIQEAIASACREIEHRTGRVFYKTDAPSTREFTCEASGLLVVDDIATRDGLLLNDKPLSPHVALLPRNGVVAGQAGWPYTRMKSAWFGEGRTYYVTATWGWDEVPAPIVEVAKMIATETFKAKDTPLGVGGFNEFGAVRVRERVHIEAKLRLYARDAVMFT